MEKVLYKKASMINFVKFTQKHLRQSSRPATLAQVFTYEFCKIFKKKKLPRNSSGDYFCIKSA